MRLFSDAGWQVTDPDVLKSEVTKVLKTVNPNFFEAEWTTSGLDTRAGQELLRRDLRQMASRTRRDAAC